MEGWMKGGWMDEGGGLGWMVAWRGRRVGGWMEGTGGVLVGVDAGGGGGGQAGWLWRRFGAVRSLGYGTVRFGSGCGKR